MYQNINELAESPSFRGRVRAAIAMRAAFVIGEDTANMGNGQAGKRAALADRALADPSPLVNAFIWPVLTNGDISSMGMEAPDSDLEYVIDVTWDRVAGVTAADKAKTA